MGEKENIKALFIRFAEGTATPGEKEYIREYLLEGGTAEDLPLPEDLAPGGPEMTALEAEQVYGAIITAPPARIRRIGWWRVAAAAIVLGMAACAGWYWWLREPAATFIVADGQTAKTVQLADGTTVQLKAGSVLKVAGDFGKQRREVEITGAAWFAVEAAADRPFIVHTPHALNVEVLGTEFNVDVREGKTRVLLTRGSVKVRLNTVNNTHEMLLKPGQMADFDPVRKTFSRREADTLLYAAWKENLLTFRNETLAGVARQLHREFGQELRFADTSLQSLLFTGYLSSTDIRTSIKTVEQTFDLQAQRINQNTILIQKKTK
jgi:ferric-dicitrate binding protein FerR (iron transport regulator)